MRVGAYRVGSFACAQPESDVEMTQAAWDAEVADFVARGYTTAQAEQLAARPGVYLVPDVTTDDEGEANYSNLYPGMGGSTQRRSTRIRGAASMRYRIRLIGYGELSGWLSGANWRQRTNEPGLVNFTYPWDATYSANLHAPKKVRLCDSDGYLVDVFWIKQKLVPKRRDDGRTVVTVEAHNALGTLADTWVPQYPSTRAKLTADTTAAATAATISGYTDVPLNGTLLIDSERCTFTHSAGNLTLVRGVDGTTAAEHVAESTVLIGKTYKAHIAALLAEYQDPVIVSPYSVKTDLDEGLVFLEFHDQSILDCIKEMHQMTGLSGQYAVTSRGQFVWAERLGSSGNITLGTNLKGLEPTHNESSFCTRLYLYGGGDLEDRLGLPAPGYVENNVATYGIVPKSMTVPGIYDPVTLLRIANALIKILSNPDISYHVTAVDDKASSTRARLCIGSLVNLVDSELSVDISETVVEINRPLDDLNTQYVLGRPTKDLPRLIEDLAKKIQAQEAKRRLISAAVNGSSAAPLENRKTAVLGASSRFMREDAQPVGIQLKFATSFAGLPNTDIDETAIGRVTAGVDAGKLYKRNSTNTVWVDMSVAEALEAGVEGVSQGILTAWYGAGGNTPGALRLGSPNGTKWYIFVEDDGTVKVHNAVPTANPDGNIVGQQF